MKNNDFRNVKLIARRNDKESFFDIYVCVGGREEYLMSHRYNPYIYKVLVNGVSVSEFERAKRKLISSVAMTGNRFSKGKLNSKLRSKKNFSKRIENSMNHIVWVMSDYLMYEACEYEISVAA